MAMRAVVYGDVELFTGDMLDYRKTFTTLGQLTEAIELVESNRNVTNYHLTVSVCDDSVPNSNRCFTVQPYW